MYLPTKTLLWRNDQKLRTKYGIRIARPRCNRVDVGKEVADKRIRVFILEAHKPTPWLFHVDVSDRVSCMLRPLGECGNQCRGVAIMCL